MSGFTDACVAAFGPVLSRYGYELAEVAEDAWSDAVTWRAGDRSVVVSDDKRERLVEVTLCREAAGLDVPVPPMLRDGGRICAPLWALAEVTDGPGPGPGRGSGPAGSGRRGRGRKLGDLVPDGYGDDRLAVLPDLAAATERHAAAVLAGDWSAAAAVERVLRRNARARDDD